MKKFFNTKATDITLGQYVAMIVATYVGAFIGYICHKEIKAEAEDFVKSVNKKVNNKE